jgi:hypothetical protein
VDAGQYAISADANGPLSDGEVDRVVQAMENGLRAGDWDGAVIAAADAFPGQGASVDGGGIVWIVVILVAIAVGFVLRFVGEGALIEGIVRARQGGTMTTREGFRRGWAHCGVLLRIGLLYIAATIASLVVVAIPCVIAFRAVGTIAGIIFAVPALVIAVPWLVTLHLVQGFASRIAVFENRHALDAIHKARLFLHGRLRHGLKVVVASFAGTVLLFAIGLAAVVPVALLLVALVQILGLVPVIVIGCVLLLPALAVLAAMTGTLRSSIWTIGYVTQVET